MTNRTRKLFPSINIYDAISNKYTLNICFKSLLSQSTQGCTIFCPSFRRTSRTPDATELDLQSPSS